MSNDAGVIEHITVPSLSSASLASKRCTGSISIISTSTSSIAGMVLWNASEALSNKITSKNMKRVASPWNRRNYYLIAKHLVWTDYMRSQKQTQVHEDEHNILVPGRSRQEEGPLRHVRNRGNLLGIVLRLQSQSNKLEGAKRKCSSCAATLDAIGWRNYRGTHPGVRRWLDKFAWKINQ